MSKNEWLEESKKHSLENWIKETHTMTEHERKTILEYLETYKKLYLENERMTAFVMRSELKYLQELYNNQIGVKEFKLAVKNSFKSPHYKWIHNLEDIVKNINKLRKKNSLDYDEMHKKYFSKEQYSDKDKYLATLDESSLRNFLENVDYEEIKWIKGCSAFSETNKKIKEYGIMLRDF